MKLCTFNITIVFGSMIFAFLIILVFATWVLNKQLKRKKKLLRNQPEGDVCVNCGEVEYIVAHQQILMEIVVIKLNRLMSDSEYKHYYSFDSRDELINEILTYFHMPKTKLVRDTVCAHCGKQHWGIPHMYTTVEEIFKNLCIKHKK